MNLLHSNVISGLDPFPQSLETAIPFPALLLCFVYLEAGLPPDAALRSAMADYEHSFASWELKLL
jgi:hypothetical protein